MNVLPLDEGEDKVFELGDEKVELIAIAYYLAIDWQLKENFNVPSFCKRFFSGFEVPIT